MRRNVSVGLRYLQSWLSGTGAAAIDDLMEDAATAEISRAQVWQWVHRGVRMDNGAVVTDDLVRHNGHRGAGQGVGRERGGSRTWADAFEPSSSRWRCPDDFVEFLTIPAYQLLCVDNPITPSPPSAAMTAPVSAEDSGPQSQATTAATSSGSSSRRTSRWGAKSSSPGSP